MFTTDGEWEYYYDDRKGTSRRKTYVIDSKQNLPRGKGWRGIYKIEKDTLTLCLVNSPRERPKTFESSAERTITEWVFKRVIPKD